MPVFVVPRWSTWMPHFGHVPGMASSSLPTCTTHETPRQTTADSRLDATRIPAHGAAAEAKRTPAHDAAAVQHGGPCYAGTSATCTSGALTTLPCSVSGVQRGIRRSCVLSGRWLSPRRRPGQAHSWTRGPSAQRPTRRAPSLLSITRQSTHKSSWVRIKLCLHHWRLSCFSST